MPYLKFRYHLLDPTSDASVLAELTAFTEHLVIRHEADEKVARTHWHALLFTAETANNVRTRLKRRLPFLNKSVYSVGVIRPGEHVRYVQYMCHMSGHNDPVVVVARQSMQFPDDKLLELHNSFWLEHARLTAPSTEATPVNQRPKLHEVLLEYCHFHDVDTTRPADIIDAAIRLWRSQNKSIPVHHIDACVNFVLAQNREGRDLLRGRLLRPWQF